MKRSTARWTTSLAAAALLGLPAAGMAQTPATAQPTATTAQQPPATTSAQPDHTQTTGSTSSIQPPDTATQTGAAAEPQADQEAARRHLTEARDTLSQLTQLPAAAQLSGEARTQVSQLIANLNELITTQNEWRASYTKVDANLDALLGPDNTDAKRTGGVSAGTTGTTRAVGASGTTATVNLDPAIRAKLVELRQKLNEFEKAASDNVTATAGAATEAMRHIAAIEAILNANDASTMGTTIGTSGTNPPATAGSTTPSTTSANLTLTRAQLDQLRTHLNGLKRLLGEARK